MKKTKYFMRQTFIAAVIMLLVGAAPAPVLAQEAWTTEDAGTAGTSTQTAVDTPTNGTNAPTGSAAGTYQYNQGTGLWENDYYTWNPSTKVTQPKVPLEYTYNPLTGMWDTQVWQYSAAKGSYSQRVVSLTVPPAGSITYGGPKPVLKDPQVNASVDSTDNDSGSASIGGAGQTNAPLDGTSQQNIASTPQNALGGKPNTNQPGTTLIFNNSGTITNNIDSLALSGDARVISNTTAGNASSGNATTMANLINLLQSQSSFGSMGGNGFATFTTDIQGNVSGDLLIDPAAFAQPANLGTQNLTNYKLTDKTQGTIVNNVDLSAGSGNAAAAQNTSVGDVTSGNANAIANVVNMINSVVAANQSFMGVINIHGDYSGNILVPTESLNALLGSSGSGVSTTVGQTADTRVTTNSEQNIANNVNLAAVSGTAAASENTRAGNVTSGDGLTNLTILNLTGRQVVAANSLLVFVNVLGSWVGLIMDAPAGSTSAAFGGGVTANNAVASKTDLDSSQNLGITNNINATAASGDATATKNTSAGDVRTGNATASANVANLIGSNFSLSNWFGVLFINVFGTWRGNFGVAKPPVVPPITSGVSGSGSGVAEAFNRAKVFAFTTSASSNGQKLGLSPLSQAQTDSTVTSEAMVDKVSKVLSASSIKDAGRNLNRPATAQQNISDSGFNWSALMVALGLSGFGLIGVERVRGNLRRKQLQ